MLRALAIVCLLFLAGPARADLRGFVSEAHPPAGQQQFFAGLRVARPVGTLLRKVGLGRWLRERPIVQVTNQTLDRFTRSTAKGYLEMVVPANKGHVFFRHGEKVYDFYQGGFRVGPVCPVGSERYGVLVRLTPEQEARLDGYLGRLERTGGKELGTYDFQGEKGHHCVSWLMRLPLDGQGRDLVGLLGGKPRHAGGMVGFSRFMLRKARGASGGAGVEAVAVYNDSPRPLTRMAFDLITHRGISRAYREASRGQ